MSSREQISVRLPGELHVLVDREAKRNKQSRGAVIRDALSMYFRLRRISAEHATPLERAAIAEGLADYKKGDVLTLDEWRHAVGIERR